MKLSHILSALFICLTIGASAAATTTFSGDDEKTPSTHTSDLKKLVDKHVIYPVFQAAHMQGTVEVSFKIDVEGKIKILNVQSTNPELVDYVVKKLKKIQLEDNDDSIGKTIKYRFVFKKQA